MKNISLIYLDLNGLNSAEIIYDDTSSDASDSNSAGGAGNGN